MGRYRLAIVVPARNEEKTIKKVIMSLKKFGDVLIVDDSSTDKTPIIVKNLQVKVIRNKVKLGYEATLLKGIKYLLKKNYKYIASFDADGEHDPKFFLNIKKLKSFDLLIGKRKKLNRFSEYFFRLPCIFLQRAYEKGKDQSMVYTLFEIFSISANSGQWSLILIFFT